MLKEDWDYGDLSVEQTTLYDAGYNACIEGKDESGCPEPWKDLSRDSEMTEQAEIWMAGWLEGEQEGALLYNAGYLANEIGVKLVGDCESEILADDAPWAVREWLRGYLAAVANAKGQPENQTRH